jgi:hypothetical protein
LKAVGGRRRGEFPRRARSIWPVTATGVHEGSARMKRLGLLATLLLVGSSILIIPGTAAAASPTTVCDGGIGPGTYHKVVVPADAICFASGPIVIRGGLYVGRGATFSLGSEEDPTPQGTINGGVHATNAANVQIHFTTINGGVDIEGGSGPFYENTPFCFPEDENDPNSPVVCLTFNAIEDNLIHGGVTINGYDGFWLGFIRNTVSGTVSLTNNTVTDPDGNEYVSNTIKGSLHCSGNDPMPQVGDSMGEENVVTGQKTGQCAELS